MKIQFLCVSWIATDFNNLWIDLNPQSLTNKNPSQSNPLRSSFKIHLRILILNYKTISRICVFLTAGNKQWTVLIFQHGASNEKKLENNILLKVEKFAILNSKVREMRHKFSAWKKCSPSVSDCWILFFFFCERSWPHAVSSLTWMSMHWKLHSRSWYLFILESISLLQLNTEWAQVELIDLVNDGSGLGFGIIGGRSTGVVVKTILPGGVADRVSRFYFISLFNFFDNIILGWSITKRWSYIANRRCQFTGNGLGAGGCCVTPIGQPCTARCCSARWKWKLSGADFVFSIDPNH